MACSSARKDRRIDVPNDNTTDVASERHQIAVLFWNDGAVAVAVDASRSVGHGRAWGSRGDPAVMTHSKRAISSDIPASRTSHLALEA